jgi:Ca2+-binding RTX toxin-like protein
MARITLGSGNQVHVLERDGSDDRIVDFRSLYFESTLDEAQEVPPNDDDADIEGTGTGVLNFDRDRFEFSLDIDGIDLEGGDDPDDMTDAHIHGGAEGEAGPIIFHFLNDSETEVDDDAGTITGGWDRDEADAGAEDMSAANVRALRAEETYFNIHTNLDTSGFIRGQILRDGGARDRVDLTELNIGSLATLEAITNRAGVIRSFLDGEETTLRLGIAERDLRASHFVFAEDAEDDIDGTANRDDLFGAGGDDTINGRGGNDRLFGEDGADTLLGGGGDDGLHGGRGADEMTGGAGDDRFSGGRGADEMTGGAGEDRFVLSRVRETGDTAATADLITDFAVGEDVLRLRAIDARPDEDGNQAFEFVGDDPFDAPGQVRVAHVRGDTFVSLNTVGEDGREALVRLEGELDLTDGDFLL